MKRANLRRQGKGSIELIEEAIHALRTAPATALAAYYLGSLPFVLGLLFFWADMSRSPFANRHHTEAALGVAALFLWMKFWQSVFAIRLRAHVSGEQPAALDFARCQRIFVSQAALQPTALFVLPLAAVPALPFAWAYAFYQNLTVQADSESAGLRVIAGKAWRQATLWPSQNHVVLSFMSLFGLFVFINWCIACYLLPHLAKMLFGVESIFTRGGIAMLNTTFFMTMCGLTYLCVDPILKAVYVLRCFYGESMQTGDDLKADLKQYAAPAQRVAACVLVALTLATATPIHAADSAPATEPSPAPPGVSPADLDRSINQVIQERKYTWRLPREKAVEPEDAERGVIARFFERVGKMLKDSIKAVFNWLDDLLRRLFSSRRSSTGGGSGYGWMMSLEVLLYTLLAVVIAATAIFLMRNWHFRRRKLNAIATQAIQPVPDLTDESVGADQLPEDEWVKLARELLERGELRLALRAFYLASLAHLAEKNLIGLARFKSNRDYERELGRRSHSLPELLPIFTENVSVFDRSWYGTHEVTGEVVNQFAANVERIKTSG
jgi:hypothetical protein